MIIRYIIYAEIGHPGKLTKLIMSKPNVTSSKPNIKPPMRLPIKNNKWANTKWLSSHNRSIDLGLLNTQEKLILEVLNEMFGWHPEIENSDVDVCSENQKMPRM